ncbi:putative prophage phiRv2 integrase [Microbispora rosea subsp. aerata]|nr:tyrosine-type recombinase/integrase [Microbispora rosea]GGO28938.1 putative prophage phiRv2 integrase [Microbispora rosea subsp. aerata]GIH58790.1 putative prophage phiRv2 integrase [Microbispora rosea subsp. aerata]GLJ86735.1 putative prophage phiRv2 integrase [Microbispora rosea subsp. aerata]
MSKRRFGRIRRLPSGRFQARYPGPDGVDRPAPTTFATKREADIWLTKKEAEIHSGDWLNPDRGKVSFKEYGAAWVDERPGLRPKTVQLYEGLLRLHLVPTFGNQAVNEIREAHVRKWRKSLLDGGVGPVTVAKAYRLLKAIFNTAIDDGLIKSNPCKIKGAGKEESPERPVLTMKQVFALADAIDPRYRMLILLATFASLRWGELAALKRKNVDVEAGTIRVTGSTTELKDGSVTIGPPKSEAGKRIVSVPAVLLADLRAHLETYAEAGDEGFVFVGPKGAQLRRANFTRIWSRALKGAQLSGFHFHDLRHTGNTFAAQSGATLRELMNRMGHSTTRAALIYQHTAMERDRAIADALGKLAEEALSKQDPDGSGT